MGNLFVFDGRCLSLSCSVEFLPAAFFLAYGELLAEAVAGPRIPRYSDPILDVCFSQGRCRSGSEGEAEIPKGYQARAAVLPFVTFSDPTFRLTPDSGRFDAK